MNPFAPEHDTPEAQAPTPPDDDDAAPSPEFAHALEAHERAAPPAGEREFKPGEHVRGTLVSIGDEHSMVDVGGRSEAVIETRHLKDAAGALKHGIGDALELYVLQADPLTLGPSVKAEARAALQQLREAQKSGVPVTGRVTGRNAGGLEVDVSGARGFCPASQIELGFCADPSVYVGRSLEFLVTEVKDGRNVVLSRRALLRRGAEEQGLRLLETIKPNDELEGTVARLEAFGAFVDLGGIDGLVHVSEIRHERTGHPKEALKVGEKLRVRVLRVEKGKDGKPRIALSIKAAAPDPWSGIEERFTKGERVQGTVVRLTDFGAFVNLAPGIDGLIHVSEAATHPVAHVRDVFQAGQQVEALVLGVDPAKKRIALSVREAAGGSAPERAPAEGDVVQGFVSGVKPFGVFVDLPAYGRRSRGLIPREETGAPRDSDLGRRFNPGDEVEVEVLELKEGRIRLRLRNAPGAADTGSVAPAAAAAPPADRDPARRPNRRERDRERGRGRGEPAAGQREDRRERFDRSDRGDRGDRGGSATVPSRPSAEPGELTTMALALRKALEKQRERESRGE